MGIMRPELWQSVHEYVSAVRSTWWAIMLGGVFAIIGALRELKIIPNSTRAPSWLWLALTLVCFSWAQFVAFHQVRVQRDEARAARVAERREPGELAQRLLVLAKRHRERLLLSSGRSVFVRVGARNFKGPKARRALDELIDRGFVRWDQGDIYVVTPAGADAAEAILAMRGPAWADERDPETETEE